MPNLPNKTVILIDDDQSMLSLLAKLLEIEGFHVTSLRSPEVQTVLGVLDSLRPFAMIMDVHLEGRNGLELLKSIRAHPYSYPLRVMMTSGEDLRNPCLEAGADGFLLKPYMPTDLITWLRAQIHLIDKKEG
jgi:DNA-binding response OmpR family regulator